MDVDPLTSTVTTPADPPEPAAAVVEMAEKWVGVPPSMLSDPALSVTAPALPAPKVAERIWAPLAIVAAPPAVTETWPALPLDCAVELVTPVNAVEPLPSTLSDAA